MGDLVIYNLKAEDIGKLPVADDFLNEPLKEYLIKDVVVSYLAGLRQGTHSTKGTSDISGSSKKLYKQKGTGNARSGSKKGVQRRGGGTQFGPIPRSHSTKINRKVLKQALAGTVADLMRSEKLVVFKNFALDEIKTSQIKNFLDIYKTKKVLIIDNNGFDDNFFLSARNFKNVKLILQKNINVYELLRYKKVFIAEEAVKKLIARLSNE